MPKILVANNNRVIEVMMLRSILASLQINEIPIQTLCGGKALCGKCAVRVIQGAKSLTSKNQKEIQRLSAMNADDDIRLACQAYPGKDAVIEVLNFGRKDD